MTHGLLSRTVVTTAGVGIQGLARFIYTLAIARVVGPEALGEVSAILSLAVYLALFWPTAAGIAASRYLPSPQHADGYLFELKRTFLLSSLLFTVLSFPVAWWMTGNVLTALAASALVLSYGAYVFVRGALLGRDQYIRATILDTASSLTTLTFLVLVLIGRMDAALLLPLAVGYTLFALAGWPRGLNVRLAEERRTPLRYYLIHTTVAALATGGLLPATMIFVQAFDTAQSAGVFAAGLSLATPASLLSQSLNQVLIPFFSRVQNDKPSAVASTHLRVFLVSTLAFALIFAALIVLAPFLLGVLYGPTYVAGTIPTQVLLGVVLLISCTSAPSALLMVTGNQRLYSRVWLCAFIVGTLVMAILAPVLGMIGALAGFAVGGGGGSIAVMVAAIVKARSGVEAGATQAS